MKTQILMATTPSDLNDQIAEFEKDGWQTVGSHQVITRTVEYIGGGHGHPIREQHHVNYSITIKKVTAEKRGIHALFPEELDNENMDTV